MKRVITPMFLISVLAVPLTLQASDNAAKAFSSDESSVNTLAGTIIGGALTAHPAGTMIGGIVGFFAGERSKEDESDTTSMKTNSARQSADSTLPGKTQLANPSSCKSYASLTSTESLEANTSTAFINFGTVFASEKLSQEKNTQETPAQLAIRAQLQQRLCYYMMN